MSRIDKAVILAAGLGNRISAASRGTPKPLLPIDEEGNTFIDWHLRALSAAGVREIYIVGNQATFGTKTNAMAEVKATWILNPTEDLSTSGSGHSAQYAWNSEHGILDDNSRVVLMDADIVYDPKIYGLIASGNAERSTTLICSDYRHTDEEVLVFGEGGRNGAPRIHGKGLLGTGLVRDEDCIGEATGILLFEGKDHRFLKRATDWCISFSTAKKKSEHEDITQRMMLADRMGSVTFGKDVAFMECDTPEEYEILRREMMPRLGARCF